RTIPSSVAVAICAVEYVALPSHRMAALMATRRNLCILMCNSSPALLRPDGRPGCVPGPSPVQIRSVCRLTPGAPAEAEVSPGLFYGCQIAGVRVFYEVR